MTFSTFVIQIWKFRHITQNTLCFFRQQSNAIPALLPITCPISQKAPRPQTDEALFDIMLF